MQGKVEMQITDIGEIPMEWSTKTLAEIGTFSKGCGVSRDEAMSGDLPCVRYGEIYTNHNDYIKQFTSFISPEVARQSHLMKKGDVLMTCSGETKEDIAKAVAFLDDFEAYAGGDIIIMSPYDEYDPLYLGYILNTASAIEQKASCAQGDSVVHISTDAVKGITIPIPPTKDEQTRIAKALSEMDDLIISLDELIEKKNAIKQGAMQKLLSGETRLKGYSGEWVSDSLGECEYVSGSGFPLDYQNGRSGDYAFFKVSDFNNVENKKALLKAKNYITKDVAKILACNIIPPESIVIAKIGAAIYLERKKITVEDCCIDNNMLAIIPQKHDPFFLRYYLETLTLSDYAETTALPYLCDRSLSEVELFVPKDNEEQTAIANIISDMEDEITQLEAERDKYKLIREGMAQQLLTGKIRLI